MKYAGTSLIRLPIHWHQTVRSALVHGGSQHLRCSVQVFFQDLGVNFYGVRALASEELF